MPRHPVPTTSTSSDEGRVQAGSKSCHGCISSIFVAVWQTMSTTVIAQELAAVKQRLAALKARLKPDPKLA